MRFSTSSFIANQQIPIKYTCDGEGLMPEISWSDFPPETKSFALVVEDPDAPMGTYVHLIAVNIPKEVIQLSEGDTIVPQAQMIPNTSGKTSYVPPCPPNGSHRYIFKIFALNIETIKGINKDNFYQKINPYILDSAELVGFYQRTR